MHTGGATAVLPTGTTVVVVAYAPGAEGFAARPEAYAEMETQVVPAHEREPSTYSGYNLVIRLDRLGKDFRRLSSSPASADV